MDFSSLSVKELIFAGLALFGLLVQLWFLLVRVRPLAFFKQADTTTPFSEPVSVIICAKNEADNLEKFLPEILTQDYPEFEVIVVNDCSEDETEMVLARLKERFPKLYYTSIPVDRKFFHGKKLALTIGVKAANSEYLVLTDADCKPSGSQWLNQMAQGFSDRNKEIVLGFGGYEKRRGFINQLVRYDTFFAAIQYMGFALSRKPYMGVGRNLAYKKSLFIRNNGLKNHVHIQSGDDDLFVQETASKTNTTVVIHPEAQTISVPPQTLNTWRNQKMRHLTTTSLYKSGIKTELFLEPFSRIIFWLSAIVLIFFNTFALMAAGAMLFKWLIKIYLWSMISKKLNQGRIFWTMFWFEFLHPILLMWAFSGNLFSRSKSKWK